MKKNKNIGLYVALVAVVEVIILGFFLPKANKPLIPENATIRTTQSEVKAKVTTKSTEKSNKEVTKQSTTEPAKEVVKETIPQVSMGERNALKKAKEYLNYSPFSYNGLIKQLEFEGFTHDECIYGVDNCGANWNEQAVKKAKEYLEYSSFSRQGLINQLLFEGFSQEQAEYGVSKVGY